MSADRLLLTNALEAAKIDRPTAERIATEKYAIHQNVATKQDLLALEAKLELVKHQLFTRLGGLMVVLVGLLFVEGIVAKRLDDPYGPRMRWLKISQKDGRSELFNGPRSSQGPRHRR